MAEVGAAIWDAVDSDNDGEWSLKEIMKAIKCYAKMTKQSLKKGWRKEVKEAFEYVDKNNSGTVSKEEFKAAVKEHGYPDLDKLMDDKKGGKKGKKGGKKAKK